MFAVVHTLFSKIGTKKNLLITHDQCAHDNEKHSRLNQQCGGPQNQAFGKPDEHHTNVHWIASKSVQTVDDESSGFIKQREGSATAMFKFPDTPYQNCQACDSQEEGKDVFRSRHRRSGNFTGSQELIREISRNRPRKQNRHGYAFKSERIFLKHACYGQPFK